MSRQNTLKYINTAICIFFLNSIFAQNFQNLKQVSKCSDKHIFFDTTQQNIYVQDGSKIKKLGRFFNTSFSAPQVDIIPFNGEKCSLLIIESFILDFDTSYIDLSVFYLKNTLKYPLVLHVSNLMKQYLGSGFYSDISVFTSSSGKILNIVQLDSNKVAINKKSYILEGLKFRSIK